MVIEIRGDVEGDTSLLESSLEAKLFSHCKTIEKTTGSQNEVHK